MMSGMYSAISGLDAHQTMLNVTANNLANVDTVGYKAQSTVFSDELSSLVRAGTGPNGYTAGTNPLQVGLGVQVGSIQNMMGQGGTQTTGNATDVLVQGDGFLQVANGQPGTPPAAGGTIGLTNETTPHGRHHRHPELRNLRPNRLDRDLDRTGRGRLVHRCDHSAAGDRGLPIAG